MLPTALRQEHLLFWHLLYDFKQIKFYLFKSNIAPLHPSMFGPIIVSSV